MMRLNLLTKLALALGAVGLLPLGVVSWQLVDMNRSALTEQVLRLHSVAARTAASRVESFLRGCASLSASLAANRILSDDPAAPGAVELLRGTLEAEPDLGAAALVGADRKPLVRAQRRDLPETVLTAMSESAASVPRVLRADGQLWVLLSTRLATRDGVLETAWSAASIEGLLRPEEIGELAEIVLASGAGVVIAGSLPSLDDLPPDLVAAAGTGRISGAGRFRDAAGRVLLGAYAPVPGTTWYVVSSQPAEVAEALAHEMRRRAFWAIGGTVGLVAALLVVAFRSTVRPLRDLVRAHADSGGGLQAAGDEVDQLRRAFAALERRVNAREPLGREPVFLGRYEVLEPLGTGGAGMVFHGWDPTLRRPVAIKTFRLDAGTDTGNRPALVEDLLAEAVTVAGFAHPNIVAVFDAASTPTVAFVAMELVDGVSLEALLQMQGRLADDQVIPLAAAIARGLAAAHATGLVHGDIKPGNILLGRDGSIKVADFGLARAMSSLATANGEVYGTPGYIAPEVLLGQPGDDRVDLFALGVVMYRCLCGVLPFAGHDASERFANTLSGQYRSLTGMGVAAAPELEMIVATLLENDPQSRVIRAQSLTTLLERMAAGRRLAWRPPNDLMQARVMASAEPLLTHSRIGEAREAGRRHG